MKPITFRPTPDAMKALAVLMHEWDCNRSQAVNRALVGMAVVPPDGLTSTPLQKVIAAEPQDFTPPQSTPTRFRQEIKKPEWKR